MLIIRFFNELCKPQLKCERIGHNDKLIARKIRRNAHEYRAVVADYMAEFTKCQRCKRELGPRNEQEVALFDSCSMPTLMWDQIRKQGYVKI